MRGLIKKETSNSNYSSSNNLSPLKYSLPSAMRVFHFFPQFLYAYWKALYGSFCKIACTYNSNYRISELKMSSF